VALIWMQHVVLGVPFVDEDVTLICCRVKKCEGHVGQFWVRTSSEMRVSQVPRVSSD